MKFSLSKKQLIFAVTALILTFFGLYLVITRNSDQLHYITDTVQRGSITQTVDVTGTLTSVGAVHLGFAQSGVINKLNVKLGQRVVQGQILASLDTGSQNAAIREAAANLAAKNAGATLEDVALAEAELKVAEANLAAAKIDAQNATTNLALTETAAQITLDATQHDIETETSTLLRTASDARNNQITNYSTSTAHIRSALASADQILGVENTLFNQNFKTELAAGNPSLLSNAVSKFEQAANARDLAETAVSNLTGSSTETDLSNAENLLTYAFSLTDQTLSVTHQVLDATFADSMDLSLEDLVAYKSSILSAESSLSSARSALDTVSQEYTNALENSNTNVVAAVLSTNSAEIKASQDISGARSAVTQAEAAVVTAEASVNQATASLNKILALPRATDLAPLEAALIGAEAQLASSQIVAPFNGTVTAIFGKTHETAAFGTTIITLTTDTDVLEVKMEVAESDVVKMLPGNKTAITFDALGDDALFTGTVSSINQAETIIEGVVFYEATVLFDQGQDTNLLKNGMSANVSVTTDVRAQTLFIPQRAILENNKLKYVRILHGDSYEERTVTTGLRGDEGKTEILTGLTENEVIIVSTQL